MNILFDSVSKLQSMLLQVYYPAPHTTVWTFCEPSAVSGMLRSDRRAEERRARRRTKVRAHGMGHVPKFSNPDCAWHGLLLINMEVGHSYETTILHLVPLVSFLLTIERVDHCKSRTERLHGRHRVSVLLGSAKRSMAPDRELRVARDKAGFH